ncbi:MAG: Rid family hydrolase [Verrucomicrobiota bacterium]
MKQRTQPQLEIVAESFGSLWSRAIPKAGWTEFLLGAIPGSGASPKGWLADLSDFVKQTGATLVELDAFGDELLIGEVREALAASIFATLPVSLLVNDSNCSPMGGGLLVRAVLGVAVEPVVYHGRTLGFHFEDENATYAYLGGLVPDDGGQDGAGQTTQVMADIRGGLRSVGMGFRDVVRTWYYLDGILSWYDDFNRARTEFFKEHDVFSKMMPASTGIGIANASGKLVLAKVHALRPKNEHCQARVADSPLQGCAYAYGSAFSRALELRSPDGRTLHISGTASIAPSGETEYVDDVVKQIQRTLEVVTAILHHAGMDWSDTVRGIAYFRDAKDMALWEAARQSLNLPARVELVVHADVCRNDLLFELELESSTA